MGFRKYPMLEEEFDRTRGFDKHTLVLAERCINNQVQFGACASFDFPIRMEELGPGGPQNVIYLTKIEGEMLYSALPNWNTVKRAKQNLRWALKQIPTLPETWATWTS